MARKPTGNPVGRPKTEIDQATFEELCHIQCTESEIAGVFRCSIETLSTWCKETYGENFLDIYKMLSEGGKSSLRHKQWKLADTNATMAIWLGKQMLNQTDTVQADIDIGTSDTELNKLVKQINKDLRNGNNPEDK